MQTRFFWTMTCLVALALTATVRADDKPATARKPVVIVTDGANKARLTNRVELVQSVTIDPTGRYLVSTVRTASPRTLGVAVSPADPVLRANVPATKGKLGLVVTSVVKDSPAAKAEIHTGDILLKLAAKDLATVADLTVAVQKAKSPADASLIRAGKTLTVRVRFPESAKTVRNLAGAYEVFLRLDAGSKYTIGVGSKPVDATLASQLVLPPSTGFIITSVAKDSAAAKAGLQPHDVILTVADQYVTGAWDLGKALDKAAGKPVKIEFLRSGRKQSCTVTPTKRDAGALMRYWSLRELHPPMVYRPDGGKVLMSRKDSRWQINSRILRAYGQSSAPDLETQVDRLSKQVDELKKTLDALKKQLSVRKTKVKIIKSK